MHSIRRMTLTSLVAIMLVATLAGTTSAAGKKPQGYRVTIVNLASGQAFTPPLIAAHRPTLEHFSRSDRRPAMASRRSPRTAT